MKLSLLIVALALAGSLTAAAGDWPHARGPAFDGVSDEAGLADAWPPLGPPQVWSRDLGQGFSGVVVAEGRLFTQYQTSAGQFLVCLDPVTGDTLWETRYDRPWQHHGAYPGPYATPTCAGRNVYFTSPTGLVGCAHAETGAIVWSLDLKDRFPPRGPRGSEFGYAATPLVEEGRVILPVGGENSSLVALDASDGHLVWAVGSDPASYCPAMPITVAGRRCVVGYLQNALLIVDAATGTVLHRQKISTGYDEHSALPIYREPQLVLTAPFAAAAVAMRLAPGAEPGIVVEPAWSSKDLSNDVVSSVLVGDHLYGFDLKQSQSSLHRPSRGAFRCLDWSTGKVRWSSSETGHAAIAAADGKLFLLSDTGDLILVRASADAYRELGRAKLFDGETCWTPPTIAHGRLFCRSPSKLLCLDISAESDKLPQGAKLERPHSWRLASSWWMMRERDFPHDAPALGELARWHLAGLALAAAAWLVSFGRRPLADAVLFALAALGPNLLSAVVDDCLFTWPMCLYVGLEMTALECSPPNSRRSGLRPRLAIAAFVLVCGLYFAACQMVGMPIGWYFLMGLVPATPFALLSARLRRRSRDVASRGLAVLSFLAGFSALLWGTELVWMWKST
jgi:outer membrane protein assembly factor BamB